jgi:hypothetical protein
MAYRRSTRVDGVLDHHRRESVLVCRGVELHMRIETDSNENCPNLDARFLAHDDHERLVHSNAAASGTRGIRWYKPRNHGDGNNKLIKFAQTQTDTTTSIHAWCRECGREIDRTSRVACTSRCSNDDDDDDDDESNQEQQRFELYPTHKTKQQNDDESSRMHLMAPGDQSMTQRRMQRRIVAGGHTRHLPYRIL